MDFVYKLNMLLENKGVTAYRMSVETGISQSTISSWRLGKSVPSGKYIDQLAQYFNITTDELLGRSTDQDTNEEDTVSIQSSPSSKAITDDERELLRYFRALSKSGRRRLLIQAEDLMVDEVSRGGGRGEQATRII